MDLIAYRSIVLDSIQAVGLTPDRFPVTMSNLASNQKRQAMFVELLGKLKAAVEASAVIKARVTELREGMSRRLEDATRTAFRDEQYAEETPESLKDLSHFGDLRSVSKAVKAAKPFAGKNKHAADVLAVYSEWETIVAALESLKAKTTTTAAVREEKKASEAKDRAAIPPSKLSAVVGAAVDAMKPQLAVSYAEFVERALDDLVRRLGPKLEGVANSGSYKFYDRTIRPVIDQKTMTISNEAMKRASDSYAEAVAAGWKDKIMSKAGELDNPEVKRMDGNTFAITGKRFGKEVVIFQDMIVNVSKLGTLFNQWPARIRVDGRAISEAAYKAMKP